MLAGNDEVSQQNLPGIPHLVQLMYRLGRRVDSGVHVCVVELHDTVWTPREYQVEAAQAALRSNRIINLPTGTGKTLVAVMLIDWFRRQSRHLLILFLVESVALVRQQSRVVREHSMFSEMLVSEITGDEAEWTAEWWNHAKGHHHVLVCTAEVARKAMVDHAFVRPSELSLVLFDEAHKAVGHHPYVEVVSRITLETTSVRIVGFTASYLHGRLADPAGKLQRLQSNLHAEIWTPHDEDIAPFLPQQRFEPIFFSQSHLDCAIGQSKTESIIEQVLNGDAGVGLIRKPLQDISKKAGTIYHLLGRQAWLVFMTDGLCPLVRAKLEVRERAFDDESSKRKIRDAIAHLDKVQVYLNVLLRMLEEPEMQDTTDKVAVLMELLRTQSAEKPDFRCLLFTEMVASTYALAGLIRGVLPETNPLPVTGVGSMPDRTCTRGVLSTFAKTMGRPLFVLTAAAGFARRTSTNSTVECRKSLWLRTAWRKASTSRLATWSFPSTSFTTSSLTYSVQAGPVTRVPRSFTSRTIQIRPSGTPP